MKITDYHEAAFRDVDFLESLEGRTLRILSEYLGPMTRLDKAKVNSTILFLGSSKADPSNADSAFYRYYWEAEELAYLLAKWAISIKTPKGKDFVVCTGAGPGIMEAANRGAVRAGGKTMGMNILLPQPQNPNPYITPELSLSFHYFFMRKFWLTYKARAVIIFPGGFGTLDEFFEIVTLLQTSKVSKKEISLVLYGADYWEDLIKFDSMVEKGAICAGDLKLFRVVSTPRQAFNYLKKKLLATLA
ncbi:MAG: LOG family protein [Candidatus Aminicenantes bacterium]|nr:LOG family protein [Candidatus Aminicenantes bacterium]